METGWRWAASSARGTSHARANTRCQDAHACRLYAPELLSVVVADGAGSAELGGEGAWLLCRVITRATSTHLANSMATMPDDTRIWDWVDQARDQIIEAARRRSLVPKAFASTMVYVLSNASESVIAHIGDGSTAIRYSETGTWQVPSWPDHGEYASTTYFVTDEPSPRLRITRIGQPVDRIVVFSDGLERLALNFATQEPHPPLLEQLCAPVAALETAGRSRELSDHLHAYLDSEPICERSDDDKTIVLACR